MSHIIKQSQSSFFPHHKISRLSAGCCPDPDPPLRCCDVISNHDSISRVYLILPAVSHELLIMHRRAPTCFSAYISWRTKSCIPPHPLQTTSSPLYPNQEAQRHVFFFLLFFSFFFYGDALVITATANRKEEKGVNVDVVDDHRRPLLKED